MGKILSVLPLASSVHAVEEFKAYTDLLDDECPAEMSLTCPVLTCDGEEELKEQGTCFRHDGEQTVALLKGGLCYDVQSAKQTDKVFVCPFNLNEYMWVDEILQGQGADRSNMCCKCHHSFPHRTS